MDAAPTLCAAVGDLSPELLMGESASGIDDADDALAIGYLDGDLVILARSVRMLQDVRAGLGQRKLDVLYTLGRDAEII